jgi:hypothetical protein
VCSKDRALSQSAEVKKEGGEQRRGRRGEKGREGERRGREWRKQGEL